MRPRASVLAAHVDGRARRVSSYSRYAHPTGVEAERALAALEGAPDGQALLFSSGSAATTALLLALLEPGKTVALAEGALLRHGRDDARRARPLGPPAASSSTRPARRRTASTSSGWRRRRTRS